MLNQLLCVLSGLGFPVIRLLRIREGGCGAHLLQIGRSYIQDQGKLALQPKNRSHHPIFL
jgi:hypothetical protein